MSLPPDFSAVPSGPPPPPPGWVPGQPPPPRPQSVTSRWGIGDIVLGLVFIIAAVVVPTIVAGAITGFGTLEALPDGDLSGDPGSGHQERLEQVVNRHIDRAR